MRDFFTPKQKKNRNVGSGSRGDASIRPNTGETNSAEGEGTALHEIIVTMRVINLVACSGAIFVEALGLLGRIVMLNHPTRAVLSVYLAFFASLLCCYELHTSVMNVSQIIEDQFGMLHHPITRGIFLCLMAGLCWRPGGGLFQAIEWALGGVFFANGCFSIFAFARYPEYRRMHMDHPQQDLVGMVTEQSARYSWTNPMGAQAGERTSLLHETLYT